MTWDEPTRIAPPRAREPPGIRTRARALRAAFDRGKSAGEGRGEGAGEITVRGAVPSRGSLDDAGTVAVCIAVASQEYCYTIQTGMGVTYVSAFAPDEVICHDARDGFWIREGEGVCLWGEEGCASPGVWAVSHFLADAPWRGGLEWNSHPHPHLHSRLRLRPQRGRGAVQRTPGRVRDGRWDGGRAHTGRFSFPACVSATESGRRRRRGACCRRRVSRRGFYQSRL
ncbi:hypothetical protein OF83DRAFT_1139717 [Amylostereum chailletii]|nr:hypothetical protein OF83DRAFT_1139717 [Amylostereum chailletii]